MACSIDICPGLNGSFNSRAGCRKPPLDLDHQDSLTGAYLAYPLRLAVGLFYLFARIVAPQRFRSST